MKYKIAASVVAIMTAVCGLSNTVDIHDLSDKSPLPKILGWQPEKNIYNVCGGYYLELPIPYEPNPNYQDQTHNYDIKADNSDLSLNGTSRLTGNVRVTQPMKSLQADRAVIYRNHEGKIDQVNLFGRVRYFTPGEMTVAERGTAYLQSNRVDMYNAGFRVDLDDAKTQIVQSPGSTSQTTTAASAQSTPAPTSTQSQPATQKKRVYGLNFWGTAKQMSQTKPKHYVLKDASYTTCSPTCNTWKVHSTTVNLDKKAEKGSAWNSVLYWEKMPVLYLPYISFPLNHKRKTGFLPPTYGHSTESGYLFSLPFYWNIAPNYDALFTTNYYSERGVMEQGKFRYLTEKSLGYLEANYLPSDRAFQQFKNKYENNTAEPEAANRLRNDSDNRYALRWADHTIFNPNWLASVDYSKVSDDYYAQDFGNQYSLNGQDNNLLQKVDLQYQNQHWNVNTYVQAYQTLHPINEPINLNQYESLPAINANGDYFNIWRNLDAGVALQGIHFYQSKTPDVSIRPVTGDRALAEPYVDYSFIGGYGYLTPKVSMKMLDYQLDHIGQLDKNNPNLAVPITSLHGGLTFYRNLDLFDSHYMETLEPEFYYLYVPYRNQNNLPIFDTYNQQFSYDELFQDNRFSGVDRIGDANQLAYALTTRFINADTGQQRARFSIGAISYFRNRDVQLCDNADGQGNCNQPLTAYDRQHLSPLVSQVVYNINQYWSGTANGAWSTYQHQFDNASTSLTYKADKNHLFNINYSFIQDFDPDSGEPVNNVKNFGVSGYWQVHHHWDLIGAWQYQWSKGEGQQGNVYLAGLGYESCCWAVRLMVMRSFDHLDNARNFKYNNSVYAQIVLKGFGGFGTNSTGDILQQYVKGYDDNFGGVNT